MGDALQNVPPLPNMFGSETPYSTSCASSPTSAALNGSIVGSPCPSPMGIHQQQSQPPIGTVFTMSAPGIFQPMANSTPIAMVAQPLPSLPPWPLAIDGNNLQPGVSMPSQQTVQEQPAQEQQHQFQQGCSSAHLQPQEFAFSHGPRQPQMYFENFMADG